MLQGPMLREVPAEIRLLYGQGPGTYVGTKHWEYSLKTRCPRTAGTCEVTEYEPEAYGSVAMPWFTILKIISKNLGLSCNLTNEGEACHAFGAGGGVGADFGCG